MRPISDRIAYRKVLYDSLVANWEPMGFDFVGTENAGEPTVPDGDNAGFPGITAGQLADLLETGVIDQSPNTPLNYANSTAITTGAYLDDPTNTPDAVLLHIGTNGITTTPPADMVDDVERILDAIEAAEGDLNSTIDTPVFLAAVIDFDAPVEAVSLYNAELKLRAGGRIAGGDNIIVVDMQNDAGLVAPGDYADTFHPNTDGYTKMANTWWAAMDAYFEGADITSTMAPGATEDQMYSFSITATGVPNTFKYSLGVTAPMGMSIDEDTGEITWTPTMADVGDHTFDVLANNFVNEDVQSITVSVSAASSAPAISGITAGNQNTDDKSSIDPFNTVTITDGDGDILTVTVTLDVGANGQLSTTDFTFNDPVYEFNGVDTDATTAIRALSFTPTENQVEPTNDVSTTFTINVNDGSSPIASDNTTTVVATSVNDAPQISFAGSLANQAVDDNGTVVPFNSVSFSDPDVNANLDVTVSINEASQGVFTNLGSFTDDGGGQYSFSGVAGDAGTNINGLTFDPTENFAAPNQMTTTNLGISVSDGIATTNENSGSVVATSINNIPTGADEQITATEDSQYDFSNADFASFSDVDTGDGLGGIRIETINGAGTFANNGGAINPGDVINTIGNLSFLSDPNDSGNNYANFDFRFIDNFGGESIVHNMNVNVSAMMDPPVVTRSVTLFNYTEGDGAVVIDNGLTLFDPDDINLESATVQITGGFEDGEDELVYTTTNGITGSYDAMTGILSMTGSFTLADYQGALQAVQYRNTNTDNPVASTRTITFTVNDGDSNNSPADDNTVDINVSGENDLPVLAGTEPVLNYTEGDNDVNIHPSITVADVDNTNLSGATVTITANFDGGEDNLLFTNQNGISGSFVGNTLTLTGSATLANYQTALRSVRYENTSENPVENQRTVRFRVDDGNVPGESNDITRNINVSGQNDAPEVTASIASFGYTEGDPAANVDSGINVSDVDDNNLSSATVQITTGFESSEDELVYTTTGGISGSYNAVTGILTLNTNATVANYQLALRAVQYRNNNTDNPSTTTRTISFVVNDGDANSTPAAEVDVNVAGDNDAPGIGGTGGALAYNEGDNDVVIDGGITVADVDNANLQSATVTIQSGFQSGQDQLLFTNQGGIMGSFTGNTLTLTGSATLAIYQTALRSVRYENTSDNPNETARVIRFVGNDGVVNSNNFDRTINVTAQNDAPVVTTSPGTTTYDEASGTPFIAVDPLLTVSDPDNATITGGTVAFTDIYINGEDLLSFTNQNGITHSFNATSGVLTLTGSSSVANYQTALETVLYFNNAGSNPTGGNREVTFTVTDGTATSTPAIKNVAVATDNATPTLTNGGIDDINVLEDALNSTVEIFEEFEDEEDADADMTFEIDGNTNPALFSSVTLVPVTGGLDLVIDYAPDAFGTSDITIRCTDTEAATITSTFTVTVTGVNDPPTTTGITDVNVNEDAPNTVIDLHAAFADPEDADNQLTFSVEENTIPGLFNAVTVNNAAGTLTLNYTDNTNGISSITVRATDSDATPLSVDASFTVSIASINDEPLLDDIADPPAILEDAGPQTINLTGINAGPNETQFMSVTASTTNTALINVSAPTYTSPQTTATLMYEPVENASGTADIEVCVTDIGPSTPAPNDNEVCKTFTVQVDAENDNPTIDPVDDPNTIFVNAGEQCINLSGISAGPGESESVFVSASSSNATLIPNDGTSLSVDYTSPNATGQVCYTPAMNEFGTATITLTVLDAGTPPRATVETFNVVVSPVNQEPEIDPIADIVVDEDATPTPLLLTGVSPGPGESQMIEFEVASDNTDLFDPTEGTGNISVSYTPGSTEANLLYTPFPNTFGTATITLTLTDEGPGDAPNDNQLVITFTITVNPINDAPTLDEIADQGVFDVGEAPPAISLTGIGPGAGETQSLSFLPATSDNQALVRDEDIMINYVDGENSGTLSYAIQPGVEGDANITVTLQDNGVSDAPNVNTMVRTFQVSVSSEPDLEITNAVLSLNEVSKGQDFTVRTTLRNNGNETVETTFLTYYFSADDVFDNDSDDLLETTQIGPVAPEEGENNFDSEPLQIIESPAGNFYIIVIVDRTNNIPELDENNNMIVIPISVNSNRFPEINFTSMPDVIAPDADVVNYRAEVSDDGLGASPVSFFYRGISSDEDFTKATVEDLGSLNFQFSLNRSEFNDPIGIEYFFEVIDIGDLRDVTPLGHTYMEYNEEGFALEDLKYGDRVNDYQMVSVPLTLQNTGTSAVFDDDFGPYNKEKWRFFRFQGGANVENGGGLDDGILPGNAYWLISKSTPTDPVDVGSGSTVRVTKDNPFMLSLKAGWNQIASPYNFNISWDEVHDANNEPAAVRPTVKTYDGSTYQDTDVLVAKSGAFVFSDTDIDLEVPVLKNDAIQNARSFTNARVSTYDDGEWEAKINISTPYHTTKVSSLGMKQGARFEKDRFDDPSSPDLGFLNHIELKFDHPEFFYKSFTKDFRAVKDGEIWEFTIAGHQEGVVTLDWGQILGNPSHDEIYLYDISEGKVIDMNKFTTYDVNLSSASLFQVYYGNKQFIEENLRPEVIHLGQSFPNPFSGITSIPFTLAKSNQNYNVQLSVFNLMGQKVKVLAEGEFQPGFYQVEWHGDNENNEIQPTGVYVYKLFVKTPDGQEKTYYKRAIHR